MFIYDFDYQREAQIDQSIEEIRNFINVLLTYEEEQTDTEEENFYKKNSSRIIYGYF